MRARYVVHVTSHRYSAQMAPRFNIAHVKPESSLSRATFFIIIFLGSHFSFISLISFSFLLLFSLLDSVDRALGIFFDPLPRDTIQYFKEPSRPRLDRLML